MIERPVTTSGSPSKPQQTQGGVAISIDNLSKTYPVPLAKLKAFLRRKTTAPVEALRAVSFEVPRGEIFGLIGRNGAGKTTLTKIVATLVQPTSGSVAVNGYDSVNDDEKVRMQLGLAGAEERSFYWRLTAEQNLLFFARLFGLRDRVAKERISELMTRLDLQDTARRRFGELSTGNKQRLSVARALLPRPSVLLLDEPTRSLDPLAATRMRELIKSLAEEEPPVTILFTSHNLAEVETLCNRVAVIARGSIQALDTPRNLRSLSNPSEVVHLKIAGLTAERAERLLAPVLQNPEIVTEGQTVVVSFTRVSDDNKLDEAIRIAQADGGTVAGVESERATLLDVLESYE